jgi:hypothetical protein
MTMLGALTCMLIIFYIHCLRESAAVTVVPTHTYFFHACLNLIHAGLSCFLQLFAGIARFLDLAE